MKVSGKRAVLAVRSALASQGLVRTSGYNGGGITGWTEAFGSTGFSVMNDMGKDWRTPTGDLNWHVVVSGRPHMRYRHWREVQGEDDTIELHEPTNPEVVLPRIRAAFKALGIEVLDAKYSGAQNHWDDDVSFNVVTKPPEWLEPRDLQNRQAAADGPVLTAFDGGGHTFNANVGILVGYVEKGRTYLTRESLLAVSTALAKAREDQARFTAMFPKAKDPTIPSLTVEGGRATYLGSRGSARWPSEVESVRLTNAWGDEVECWQAPSYALKPLVEFAPTVPFVVAGETRTMLPFEEHDSQMGPSPWAVELVAGAPAP